jgi:hypothetical protein
MTFRKVFTPQQRRLIGALIGLQHALRHRDAQRVAHPGGIHLVCRSPWSHRQCCELMSLKGSIVVSFAALWHKPGTRTRFT